MGTKDCTNHPKIALGNYTSGQEEKWDCKNIKKTLFGLGVAEVNVAWSVVRKAGLLVNASLVKIINSL